MELNKKEKKIISALLNNADSLFEDMIEEIGGEYDYGFRIQDVRDLCKRFDVIELTDSEWEEHIKWEKEAISEP